METRLCILFLTMALLATSAVARADTAKPPVVKTEKPDQPIFLPPMERRSIDLAKIERHDFEIGPYVGFISVEDFGVNPIVGVRAAYHVTEDLFVEAALGRANTQLTSYERLSGSAQLLTSDQRRYTHYDVSVGYNVLPGEAFIGSGHSFNSALYLIGGLGVTSFGGADRFTVNLGFGYRFIATDSIALHLGMRDYMFNHDLLGASKMANNFELQMAATYFF